MASRLTLLSFVMLLFTSVAALASPTKCDTSYVTQIGGTWVVHPSGMIDTGNLQCALDKAAASGPGAVVRLASGDFTTGFLMVFGFDGYLIGAGRDSTVVHTPDTPLPCKAKVDQQLLPTLLMFRGGHPRISDFTLQTDSRAPCDEYKFTPGDPFPRHHIELLVVSTRVLTSEVPVIEHVSARIERMRFRGPWPLQSVAEGVENAVMYIGGPGPNIYPIYVTGDFVVADSEVQGVVQGAVFLGNLNNANVTIGGSPSSANKFSFVGSGLIGVLGFENTNVDFSHNSVLSEGVASDLWPIAGEAVEILQSSSLTSKFAITNNHIETRGIDVPAEGIGLADYSGTLQVVVSNNDVQLNSPFAGFGCCYGGAWGYGTSNAILTNNRFSGTVLTGGVFFGFTNDSGWMIKDNNFENLTVLDGVPVILFPGATGNTVVGSGNSVIWDFGIGNNIVGVSNKNGNPPGPAIKDAMKRKVEVLRRR